MRKALGMGTAVAVASLPLRSPAGAADESTIAEVPASGLLFKDIIRVDRFSDPKVKGVEIYVADFQRPLTERLQANFFSDPTQASVTCAKTGPITLADDISTSREGEEVFSQAKNLFFKSVKVRRIYDKEANTLVYLSYSVRLSKNDDDNKSRFKSTMCAVPLN